MRNLKKFLALVLAMMMVMGLMVTANAATDFTTKDGAEIEDEYESAVRILFAMGVLQGDKGVYDPLKPITRAEFATMLFRIHSGNTDDNNTKAFVQYAKFTDVKSTDWFAGAVGYAQNEGLLEGDNTSGKYNPSATVTLTQVEVGLLRALGYGQKQEFSNTGWETAANRQARINGMDKGLASDDSKDMSAKANRQAVAQLFYNTLKLPMVELNANGTYSEIQVNGGNISLNQLWFDMKEVKADDPALTNYNTENADPFGRPGVTKAAVVNGEVIPLEWAEKVGEYDGNFTAKDAEKLDSNLTGPDSTKVKVIYNGSQVHDSWRARNDTVPTPGMWHNDTTGVPGYEIEVYKHIHNNTDCSPTTANGVTTYGCTYKYDAIFMEAFLGKIAAKVADTSVTVTVYRRGGAAEDFPVTKAASAAIYADLANREEGEFVAVYPHANWSDHKILKVADLETVEVDEVEKFVGGAVAVASLKADGKDYKFHHEVQLVDAGVPQSTLTGKIAWDAATLYLHNDNIMLIDQTDEDSTPVATGDNYVYVVAYQGKAATTADLVGGMSGAAVAKAEVIFPDGTHGTIDLKVTVDTNDGNKSKANIPTAGGEVTAGEIQTTGGGNPAPAPIKNWFAYVETNGVYTLSAVDKTNKVAVPAQGTTTLTANTPKDFTVTSACYTTSKTVVVSIESTTYNITSKTGLVDASLTTTASGNEVLVVVDKDAGTVTAIYAVNQAPVASDAVYGYAIESAGTTKDGALWNFYVGGEKKTITMASGQSPAANHIYKLTETAGLYTLTTDVASADNKLTVSIADTGYVLITGYSNTITINSSTKVYDVTTAGAGKAAAIAKGDKVVIVNTSGTVVSSDAASITAAVVYIVEHAS